jgi:hypothetical protein
MNETIFMKSRNDFFKNHNCSITLTGPNSKHKYPHTVIITKITDTVEVSLIVFDEN